MPDAVLNISGLRVAYLTERGARQPVLDGLNLVVTHNVRDFGAAVRFGIRVVTPGEFLRTIEGE